MPSPDHAWPLGVDLALADRRFGAETVNRSLAEGRGYAEAPRLDGAGRLRAKITREGAGRAESQQVTLRIRDAKDVELACTCPSRYLCEHVVAVVVDLAVHAGLRAALAAGEPTEALLAELSALREVALEERTLEERLARWLPPRFDEDLVIDVEIARSATAARADERPIVLLRVRRAESRAPVKPKELAAVRLAPRDRRLLELGVPSALHKDALVSTGAQASLLIHLLRDAPHTVGNTKHRRLRFAKDSVAPRLDAEHERLIARWVTPDGRIAADAADALLFTGPFPYLWSVPHETFHPVAPEVDLDVAWGLTAIPSLPLTPAVAERVGRALLGRGRGAGVALPPPEAFGLPPIEAPSFVLRLRGSPLDVEAELTAIYGGSRVRVGSEAPSPNDAAHRDLDAEAQAIGALRAVGLVDDHGELRVDDERAVAFWQEGLPALRASASPRFEVLLGEALVSVRVGPPVSVRVHVGAASGWLETELDFTAHALKVELARLQAAITADKRWIALSDGTLARITDEIATLVGESFALFAGERRARLAPHHLGRIDRWIERFGGDSDDEVLALKSKLRALSVRAEPDLPRDLQATLRPYQRDGLAWLQFLRALGTGGVLADDMGLGKTLMTLAFLQRWKEDAGAAPSLVVCPTSVVPNWVAEAKRFTPGLRVVVFQGDALEGQTFADADLVVVTYGLLRRHIERLEAIRFRSAILDEAQNVKNEEAETARAAMRLAADMRLALTGTPIENRLGELWSILSFANPGILGSAASFEERFERPMAMRPDGAVADDLRAIVRPFLLRRTKAAVLVDLPEKTEIEHVCVLGAPQKRLYDALALTLRQAVRKNVERRGFGRSRVSVLTAILRLRQMACDPRLVDPTIPAMHSAKREAFLGLVRELASEGRRTLVFSQFVELFTLWREDLDREGLAYEYLDGSTTNRGDVVARFQNGTAPLCLVSLKAGGTGLNLTAADTVIHVDPWWNPAVEDQATDRAHRIGQSRAVTVIRLVARGTIEDKIAILKRTKRDLASVILGGPTDAGATPPDPRAALAGITEEDVRRLLGDAGEDDVPPPVAQERPEEPPEEAPPSPTHLTTLEIDEVREMVRWLDRAGVPTPDLAKKARVKLSHLTLLLIGHRVAIARSTAARIRAIYDARRTPNREEPPA